MAVNCNQEIVRQTCVAILLLIQTEKVRLVKKCSNVRKRGAKKSCLLYHTHPNFKEGRAKSGPPMHGIKKFSLCSVWTYSIMVIVMVHDCLVGYYFCSGEKTRKVLEDEDLIRRERAMK